MPLPAGERTDGHRTQPGERVLAERDLTDESGQQVERQDQDPRDHRGCRHVSVVVAQERGERNGNEDAGEDGGSTDGRRVHTVLPREKPGRNRNARVASIRRNATSELTPAPLKKARGY